MVIGDSQSEEYRFEVPFSAPESNPFEANTQNWVELLAEHRAAAFDFGEYRRNLFEWGDVRNAGYQYNWSVPGAFVSTHLEILKATVFENQQYLTSKIELLDQIDEMDAIVMFLGGNDIRSVYGRLHRDDPPAGWPQSLIDETRELIEIIRSEAPEVPLIVGDFPDVGGTEKTKTDHPGMEGRVIASQYVAQANQLLKQLLDSKGIPSFEPSSLTADLLEDDPVRIGEVEFLPFGHPENRPRYLLCKDGFHPSTSAQARIANLIVGALEQAIGETLSPLADQEILSDILGIDPTVDDDYLAWIGGFSVSNESLLADEDGDGLQNLGEFALNNHPLISDAPQPTQQGSFDFQADPGRTGYVQTQAAGSNDLQEWSVISAPPPFTLPTNFLRLEFTLRE